MLLLPKKKQQKAWLPTQNKTTFDSVVHTAATSNTAIRWRQKNHLHARQPETIDKLNTFDSSNHDYYNNGTDVCNGGGTRHRRCPFAELHKNSAAVLYEKSFATRISNDESNQAIHNKHRQLMYSLPRSTGMSGTTISTTASNTTTTSDKNNKNDNNDNNKPFIYHLLHGAFNNPPPHPRSSSSSSSSRLQQHVNYVQLNRTQVSLSASHNRSSSLTPRCTVNKSSNNDKTVADNNNNNLKSTTTTTTTTTTTKIVSCPLSSSSLLHRINAFKQQNSSSKKQQQQQQHSNAGTTTTSLSSCSVGVQVSDVDMQLK